MSCCKLEGEECSLDQAGVMLNSRGSLREWQRARSSCMLLKRLIGSGRCCTAAAERFANVSACQISSSGGQADRVAARPADMLLQSTQQA